MANKHLMIAVNWFGPYSLNEARQAARADAWSTGLYLCIGNLDDEPRAAMQYIGIGTDIRTRLHEKHHALKQVIHRRQIWLGHIDTAEPSGKKFKVTKTTLDYAEWLHARFLQLPLNDKKTKSLPPRSVTVLNRWWKKDYDTIRKNRPHPDWPDLIDYPHYDLPARAVWFGRKQRRFMSPGYLRPE